MSKGNLKKTKKCDYLADDGLWYPSSELESYFKEKPRFNSQSSAIAALKELYADSDNLNDLVYKSNPFLKMVK